MNLRLLTVLTALVWYSFGITYGVLYEGWPLSTACRFSLGAMAASGVPPPQCYKVDGYDDCQLGRYNLFVKFQILSRIKVTLTQQQADESIISSHSLRLHYQYSI